MEKLTDIELTSVSAVDAVPLLQLRISDLCKTVEDIPTPHGLIHVGIQGDPSRPAILTYHDIGMNAETCFQGFFTFSEMQPILQYFCVYHVTAPGQQSRAPTMQDYPTMDQLSEMLFLVTQHFQLKEFIGFGLGAGANILSRFALMNPGKVRGLVLVNCTSTAAGWIEWGYQKLNTWYLRSGNVSKYSEDYLLWHWFGSKTVEQNKDLTEHYRQSLKAFNPTNLSMFIQSYYSRTDLNIVRELDKDKKKEARTLKCPSLLVAGAWSPHVDDTVNMNGRLDPEITTWMKMSDSGGNPLEEQPSKFTEAFLLFLQGLGYVPFLHSSRLKHVAEQISRNQAASAPSNPCKDVGAVAGTSTDTGLTC